jgi:hypothetical protein
VRGAVVGDVRLAPLGFAVAGFALDDVQLVAGADDLAAAVDQHLAPEGLASAADGAHPGDAVALTLLVGFDPAVFRDRKVGDRRLVLHVWNLT